MYLYLLKKHAIQIYSIRLLCEVILMQIVWMNNVDRLNTIHQQTNN